MSISRSFVLSRRALLGGISAAALVPGLPRNAAAEISTPKRLIVVHVPEGMWQGAPRPTSNGGLTLAGSVLAPLERHKARVTVLNRLSIPSANRGPGGDGHHRNVPHMLTGTELQAIHIGGAPSVDQVIAQTIGGSTKYPSLHASVRIIYNDINSRPFWSGPGRVVPSVGSPWDLFDRVFAGVEAKAGSAASTPPAARPSARRSVLDFATKELDALGPRLSTDDRLRLESYTESVRDIERRLVVDAPAPGGGGGATAGCALPALGDRFDPRDEQQYQRLGRLQTDILVSALQCDITRVATLQWSNSNDQCGYRFTPIGSNARLGVDEIGHDLSHNNRNVDPTGAKKLRVTQFYAGEFAYLLDKLSAIREGAGTMLDNTVVLWVSEFGDCNGHSPQDLMWMLMGNVGGALKPGGRMLDFNNQRSVNDLHTTLCNAFGNPMTRFNNPAYCSGPIADLRA
jgi:hypothetical protein